MAEPQEPPADVRIEAEEARIERLGRQRPEGLASIWREGGFVFSIVMSQLLTEYFVSGFSVLVPTVVRELDIPAPATTWPANAFSLVLSAFLLPFGRLADMYGGFWLYIGGCIWFTIWSLLAGFAQNEIMLDVARALQGLGPAAFLPASLTVLGTMYRPGPRKNLVFSIYGAMAPFGFFVGIFFAGVAAQYTTWRWYFFIGTILAAATGVTAWFTIPNDYQKHRETGVKMDWLGSGTISAGIIFLVFAITDSSHAPHGWATPYILITFVLAFVFLGAAFYIEGWVASQPLLPLSIFQIKSMKPFLLALVFAYGAVGIYLLYATLYIQNILHASPLLSVAYWTPAGLGGVLLATLGGLILHLVPVLLLMLITGVATILAALLFALHPAHGGSYWAWVFPAMICCTLAIDLVFNLSTIFLTTSLPARQQGLAGGLANVMTQFSIALFLGLGDIVATETNWQGERESYRNAFWFELACGGVALGLFVGFVRIGRAKSDYTADEKEEQAKAEPVVAAAAAAADEMPNPSGRNFEIEL